MLKNYKGALRSIQVKTHRFLFFFFIFITPFLSAQWSEREPLPGLGKDDAVAFSVGQFGYLTTGNNGGFEESNFVYRYDPQNDTWTRLKDFPGEKRQYASCFVVGDTAYVLGGNSETGSALKDFWRYVPKEDSWTRLADFPGLARWSAACFAFGSSAYYGTGSDGTEFFNDFWKYTTETRKWSQVESFPGEGRRETAFFTVRNRAYVGLGFTFKPNLQAFSDFYEFNLLSQSWKKIKDYPLGPFFYAEGASNADFGLVIGGRNINNEFTDRTFVLTADLEWQEIVPYPEGKIKGVSTFQIGQSAYVICGIDEQNNRSNVLLQYKFQVGDDQLSVFPNPSRGQFIVSGLEGTDLQFYTVDGKMIQRESVGTNGYFLFENFQSGLFFLRSEIHGTKKSTLIIVE